MLHFRLATKMGSSFNNQMARHTEVFDRSVPSSQSLSGTINYMQAESEGLFGSSYSNGRALCIIYQAKIEPGNVGDAWKQVARGFHLYRLLNM